MHSRLLPDGGGAWAYTHDRSQMLPVHEAAATYRESPRVLIAGANYGAGSSRDWAAKAPALLGVRGVIDDLRRRQFTPRNQTGCG